ncbi:hypothetical protein R1sor_022643 [Riccia sorocarpa]|uniref:Mitochondrial import inner membrane translocase subunit Tim17/Tim22/Tim23 family protein n=1 Tax=Riccia sorocarpa TaxID=122646 RepID=A0ABD3GNF4_9MARC
MEKSGQPRSSPRSVCMVGARKCLMQLVKTMRIVRFCRDDVLELLVSSVLLGKVSMEPSSSQAHSSASVGIASFSRNQQASGARLGIGRRPVNYTGGDGWASRIGRKTLYGAGIGAAAGLSIGAFKGSSYLRWMGSASANSALVTASFCGAQEVVREIRAAEPDDPLNCIPGGLISGAALGRLHGGPSRALPCALLFAVVGTGLQYGENLLQGYRLRRFMEIRNPEFVPEKETVIEPKVDGEKWKFPEWFPIQVLDEEAAAKRKAEKELEFKMRVESLHKGEHP